MLSFYHKKLEKEVWVKSEVRRKTMAEISTEIKSMENTCACTRARARAHTHTQRNVSEIKSWFFVKTSWPNKP